jgi:hypothetical protein
MTTLENKHNDVVRGATTTSRRAAIGAVAVAIAVLGAACSSGPDRASTPSSPTTGS